MSEKKASVHWEGAGKSGQGQISTETGSLDKYPYGFASRFGDDRKGTNPEEIVGAAHAACFTMARRASGDCNFLDPQTRLCTVYDQRPETCRLHPQKKSPKPGYCAYGRRGG